MEIMPELISKDLIEVVLDKSQIITSNISTKVDFNLEKIKVGKKLKLVNGGIVIGKGIKIVKVDVILWVESVNTYSIMYIRKNNVTNSSSIFPLLNTQNWRTHNGFSLIEVEEGDIISANILFAVANAGNQVSGTNNNSCKMIVEAVEYI